jgi:hypothetical protein
MEARLALRVVVRLPVERSLVCARSHNPPFDPLHCSESFHRPAELPLPGAGVNGDLLVRVCLVHPVRGRIGRPAHIRRRDRSGGAQSHKVAVDAVREPAP